MKKSAALFVLFSVALAHAQHGALTSPRNLAQLTAQSSTIVRGHVVSAYIEPHPELRHLLTVVVTLRVDRSLKGPAGQAFTFRQFIWDIRDRSDAGGYRKGQELLLLMNRASRYGLTSPAGMEQGRFGIERDAQGHATAINGVGNAGLLRNVTARSPKAAAAMANANISSMQRGPLPLEELEALIGALAGEGQ